MKYVELLLVADKAEVRTHLHMNTHTNNTSSREVKQISVKTCVGCVGCSYFNIEKRGWFNFEWKIKWHIDCRVHHLLFLKTTWTSLTFQVNNWQMSDLISSVQFHIHVPLKLESHLESRPVCWCGCVVSSSALWFIMWFAVWEAREQFWKDQTEITRSSQLSRQGNVWLVQTTNTHLSITTTNEDALYHSTTRLWTSVWRWSVWRFGPARTW